MKFKSKYSLILTSLVLLVVFFMCGCTNYKNKNLKIDGVDTFSGVVKSVETIENSIFLVVNGYKGEKVYYSSTSADVTKDVLKLKVGDSVDVKYILGTPKKYKERMAMPLSSVKVIK